MKLQLSEATWWFSTDWESKSASSNSWPSRVLHRCFELILLCCVQDLTNPFPTKLACYTITQERSCHRSLHSGRGSYSSWLFFASLYFCSIGVSPRWPYDLQFLIAATWMPTLKWVKDATSRKIQQNLAEDSRLTNSRINLLGHWQPISWWASGCMVLSCQMTLNHDTQ